MKKKLTITIAIITGLSMGSIYLSINSAVMGQRLAEVESKTRMLSRDNRELRQTISQETSLTKVYEKSEEMGLNSPTTTIYVSDKSQEQVALQ